jgi:CheY-like chemotaxis protein
LLGGNISVESEVGKGSAFRLVVPANTAGGQNGESENLGDMSGCNHHQGKTKISFSGRVLVVEDNLTNQMLIKLLLGKLGFVITIVQNGIEAVEAVENQQFELILMDMQMPEMNGCDATEKLRSLGVKTPIIAMTASIDEDDKKRCMQAGCDDYIPKPIDRAHLVKVISHHLAAVAVSS